MIRFAIAILVFLQLSGCGTLGSFSEARVTPGPNAFGGCKCVPRIYGGSAIDTCVVIIGKWHDSGEVVGYLLYDLPFSMVLDTVALPYTVVKQIKDGNNCPKPL